MPKSYFAAVLCLLFAGASIAAQPSAPKGETDAISTPQLVNYQGKLTDADGDPLTGTYDMAFAIYDVASGGSALWNETQTDVVVTEGIFNVILGSVTPVSGLPEGPDCYLGITVETDPEISPRTRLVSVPYATMAQDADDAANLGGVPAASYATQSWVTANDAGRSGVVANLYEGATALSAKYAGITHAHSAADITSGTLPIARGGTNNTSYTQGGALYYNGSAIASTAAGTSGQFLTSQGSGAPIWTTVSASNFWTNSGSGYIYPNTPGSNTGVRIYQTGYTYNLYGQTNSSYQYGVYGYNSNSYSYAVYGYNTAQYGYGVYGYDSYYGNFGILGTGYYPIGYPCGVYAYNGGQSYSYGVYGSAGGSYSYGVVGYRSSSYGYGVYGYHASTYGYGVYGYAGSYGTGVYGYGGYYGGYFYNSSSYPTVYAYNGSYAVRGELGSYNGGHPAGVYGYGGSYYGVYGYSTGSAYAGVYGYSSSYYGVYGYGPNYFGVYGYGYYVGTYGYSTYYSPNPAYAGVLGYNGNGVGVYGCGYYYGVYGYTSSSSFTGVVGYNGYYGSQGRLGYASYGLYVYSGSKSCGMLTADYGLRSLYCVEAAEEWFEDMGEARLTDGRAHVELDPVFLQTVTVDDENPMKVFPVITTGEAIALGVVKGMTGFDVVGPDGSNASFDWRVIAKKRGSTVRLAEEPLDIIKNIPNKPGSLYQGQ